MASPPPNGGTNAVAFLRSGLIRTSVTVTAALGSVTSAPTGVTVSGAALISIALQSPSPLLPVYLTVPYRVQARYSDGSQFDHLFVDGETHTVVGFGLSGSTLYLRIASATR